MYLNFKYFLDSFFNYPCVIFCMYLVDRYIIIPPVDTCYVFQYDALLSCQRQTFFVMFNVKLSDTSSKYTLLCSLLKQMYEFINFLRHFTEKHRCCASFIPISSIFSYSFCLLYYQSTIIKLKFLSLGLRIAFIVPSTQ